ncbi:copper homeostasis protein CutC [Chelativorans salis]|uniref:PF03932 family protein CutC n=1 Tax=Chelativorans salis TaxID=2978478 RepID=A0ABT2LIJ3_9HYPH|nr:copper homeostasis protein CutC [Chelativorans sp. EGI FJ00035]MCT7374390.1 copper homeostasis protein CutC [Chelativorans sp. EGI FJ00035]
MSGILLEVCVDDPAGLAAAIDGGADRVELCSALDLGGLTPPAGLMAAAASQVPVYAMIRPRAGDFVYAEAELDVMARDIEAARQAGFAGVVFGAVKRDGSLDYHALKRLAERADGLGVTLHRAFDLVPDRAEAVEMAVELGFERILTSGGASTAAEGVEALEEAIAVAAGRISIMPGAGINVETVGLLLPRLPVSEVHASCSTAEPVSDARLVSLGFSPAKRRRTDAALVRALKERISAVG